MKFLAVAIALVAALFYFGGTATATHVVEVTIDSASVDGSGNLVVNGTIVCDSGTTDQAIIQSIAATQGGTTAAPGAVIDPNGTTTGPCEDPGNTYPWTATIAPQGGTWNWKLPVTVTATAQCCGDDGTPEEFIEVVTTADLTIANPGGQVRGNNGQGSNAGAGNGGEGAAGETDPGDVDPGKSGTKNNAPNAPKGKP